MKWIGQHIYDLISRFRDDVYLEDISSGTIASGGNLGLDSNNKIVKDSGVGVTDLHGAGVDGSANQLLTDDGDGTVTSESTLTYASPDLTIAANDAKLTLITTSDGLYDTPGIDFKYIPAGGGGTDHPTFLGQIDWYGQSDAGTTRNFARQYVKARQDNNSAECGHWNLTVMSQGTLRNVMNAEGSTGGDWVNVNLGYSTLSTTTVAGILEVDGGAINAASGSSGKPLVTLKQQNSTKTTSSEIKFLKDAADVEDDEQLGKISFYGDNDAGTPEVIQYGAIIGTVADMTDGQEAGDLLFQVAEYDGTLTTGLKLDGDTNADGEIDVTIGAGAASVTTIAGTLTVGSTAAMTNAGLLSVAAQTNITSVGNTLSIGNSTSDNAQLNIQNQTTDAEGGVLVFKKTKGLIGGILQTPNDDDEIGRTSYTYSDDASITEYDYARTVVTATDVSNGSESGKYQILASGQGSLRNVISGEGGSTSAEIDVTIANGAASNTTIAGNLIVTSDLTVSGTTTTLNTADLNVEDKNITLNYHATGDTSSTADGAGITIQDAVDASNNASLTWTAADDTFEFSHAVEINNGASGGTAALTIDNDDVDQIALDIDASNTTANVIDITAPDLTTGSVINLDINDDATTAITNTLVNIDYDKSGNMGSGETRIVTGLKMDLKDSATSNAGNVSLRGVDINLDHSGTGGTASQYGLTINGTDGDTGSMYGMEIVMEDGSKDMKFKSSANASDYAYWMTSTNGATTIVTNDADASLAHFEIEADGNITLDPAGTIALEANTTVTGDLTVNGDTVTFESANADDPVVIIKNTTADAQGARLQMRKDRGAAMVDGDRIGEIDFFGEDASQNSQQYGKIMVQALESDHGSETGRMKFQVAEYDGAVTDGIVIDGGDSDGVVSVNVGAGATSLTTIAGTLTMGSTATLNNTGEIQVASQPSITTLAGLTSLGSAGATTDIAAGDLTMYNAVNGGDPTISLGSSATNRFEIKSVYNSSAQTLDSVDFTSYTTSSVTHDARYRWFVDEVELARMLDTGFYCYKERLQVQADDATLVALDFTASSATQGGKLRLMSGDGAAMADNHRLGIMTFEGAEDASGNYTVGAQIEAFCEAAWSASENGARMVFSTTDGNASTSTVLTLDSDKKATFTGPIACASRTLALTSTLSDGDHDGDVVYFGGTTSMTVGKIYHYNSSGNWELANADATSTSDGLLGVALGEESDTHGVLLRGMVTLDHDPGAIGDVLYVQSDNAGTPGNATATAPSASGDCVRVIGYQVGHASAGLIWFNPDGTFVEVA